MKYLLTILLTLFCFTANSQFVFRSSKATAKMDTLRTNSDTLFITNKNNIKMAWLRVSGDTLYLGDDATGEKAIANMGGGSSDSSFVSVKAGAGDDTTSIRSDGTYHQYTDGSEVLSIDWNGTINTLGGFQANAGTFFSYLYPYGVLLNKGQITLRNTDSVYISGDRIYNLSRRVRSYDIGRLRIKMDNQLITTNRAEIDTSGNYFTTGVFKTATDTMATKAEVRAVTFNTSRRSVALDTVVGIQLDRSETWYNNYTISAATRLKVASGSQIGGSANITVVANGTNAPTFSAASLDGSPVTMTIDANSDVYDNVNGHKNELFIYRNGDQIWYSWRNR